MKPVFIWRNILNKYSSYLFQNESEWSPSNNVTFTTVQCREQCSEQADKRRKTPMVSAYSVKCPFYTSRRRHRAVTTAAAPGLLPALNFCVQHIPNFSVYSNHLERKMLSTLCQLNSEDFFVITYYSKNPIIFFTNICPSP